MDLLEIEREAENHSVWLERKSFRIVLLSMFSALAVVLGYLLVSLPNIELFTLAIFLSGFILGKRDGLVVGLISSFIFVFFNPYGVSPAPIFVYQLAHYSLVGIMGGITQSFFYNKEYFQSKEDLYQFPVMIIFGLIGAIITLGFDLITTLLTVIFYGTLESFLLYFLTGIVFTTIHEVGNTLAFIFILPGLIQLIYKLLD